MAAKEKRSNSWAKLIAPGIVAAIIGAITAGLISGFLVPLLQPAGHEGEIRAVIEQEASLVLAKKIDEVLLLFHKDAFIKDAAGGDKALEITWVGQEQIRERYIQLPEFKYLKHDAIQITISSDGTYARAIADTIAEYVIPAEDKKIAINYSERWTLKKVDGEWKVTSFTCNLP